jgi:opacity protein-like surface antigen
MKNIIIISFFLFINYSANAQLFIGVNTVGSFPIGENQFINYGGGVNINGGYLIKNKIELITKFEKQWFSVFADKYELISISGIVKYYPYDKQIKPYIGFGIGYFYSYLELADFENQKVNLSENVIGFSPKIGILFKTNLSDNLFVNTELSYNKILTNNNINLISLNIGIKYSF